jgi:hypothetical protein
MIALMAVAILISAVTTVQKSVKKIECQNNIKQITLGSISYFEAMGHYPPMGFHLEATTLESCPAWTAIISPFLEKSEYHQIVESRKPWDHPDIAHLTERAYASFQCPIIINQIGNRTSYLGLTGIGRDSALYPLEHPDAGFFGVLRTVESVLHPAQTTFVMETLTGGPWAQAGPSTTRGFEIDHRAFFEGKAFGSRHGGGSNSSKILGCNAGLLDGSTRFFTVRTDVNVIAAMIRIKGDKSIVIE